MRRAPVGATRWCLDQQAVEPLLIQSAQLRVEFAGPSCRVRRHMVPEAGFGQLGGGHRQHPDALPLPEATAYFRLQVPRRHQVERGFRGVMGAQHPRRPRRILSRRHAGLLQDRFELGKRNRAGTPQPGLIHHADRGSQYCAKAYRAILQQQGLIASLSRKGNGYDNAPIESFWGSLKNERVHQQHFETRSEAYAAIRAMIDFGVWECYS